MGLLNIFKREAPRPTPGVLRLPAGSFTIDASGRLVVSTLPRAFPEACVRQISQTVIEAFRAAHAAGTPLTGLVAHYSTLKLTARELRGGAIIFLAPRTLEKK